MTATTKKSALDGCTNMNKRTSTRPGAWVITRTIYTPTNGKSTTTVLYRRATRRELTPILTRLHADAGRRGYEPTDIRRGAFTAEKHGRLYFFKVEKTNVLTNI